MGEQRLLMRVHTLETMLSVGKVPDAHNMAQLLNDKRNYQVRCSKVIQIITRSYVTWSGSKRRRPGYCSCANNVCLCVFMLWRHAVFRPRCPKHTIWHSCPTMRGTIKFVILRLISYDTRFGSKRRRPECCSFVNNVCISVFMFWRPCCL